MEHMIPLKHAAHWLARMAATDGVISPREHQLLADFAKAFNLNVNSLFRMAHAIANEVHLPEVELVSQHEMKGRKFEEFVVSLCSDKSIFTLIAWRSDKIHNGVYAVENLMPDLHLRQQTPFGDVEYYIECKYRSSLPNGKLDLSTQLPRYRRMANRELFIALGLGGTPSNPAQFFIIPSRMLKHNHVINLHSIAKCLCSPNAQAFRNYIEHFFQKRVYKL